MRIPGRKPIRTLVICVSVALTGCVINPNYQQLGTVTGAVLGGYLGSQIGNGHGRTAAIIGGTLAGASIGGSIGRTMDDVDRMKLARSLEHTPTSQTASWRNPDTGVQYTVTPRRDYRKPARGHCREFSLGSHDASRYRQVTRTACRQSNGTWRLGV